ncbi:uncharacterized protein L969DRAFT_15811 [Mixia osmundae IAM 14324]|uniref:Uncharacterized protein n=1 Tax=Mixia osmundae (strain CBS 9802 / IAM 14324 / JCM 22182 / KY 12970) TaxID=764103 RepID=G7E6D0_MIXOS|nr:uncharacterized protein L969DRAFT_15811 [Mixia osmundae IAM 14324]KEI40453.1 hypothetical protein L969DRAFT_15811 [Mixia osmundae IAM 14324]GAA98390.1 hypothetical protein E5Q_05076 [Mixia osmundae IAM 14324]
MNLPGYYYDASKKRYFKTDSHRHKPVQSLLPLLSQPDGHAESPASRLPSRNHRTAGPVTLRDFERARHELLLGTFAARAVQVESREPECLFVDENITQISAVPGRKELRLGGTAGSICFASLKPPSQWARENLPSNVDPFRTEWLLGSTISSLKLHGNRFLATSLGSPAKALFAVAHDPAEDATTPVSEASITFSPAKTSLWTGSLSPDIIALGCDDKVLVSRDPLRGPNEMDSIATGSAVFALEQHRSLLFAGLRSGKVNLIDMRSSQTAALKAKSSNHSPITSLRLVREFELLVVGMKGDVEMLDTRFIQSQRPLMTLEGHINHYMRDLGCDIYNDEILALAGQDAQVRLWSLRTGKQEIGGQLGGLTQRQFEEPIKALAFVDDPPSLWVSQLSALSRWEITASASTIG